MGIKLSVTIVAYNNYKDIKEAVSTLEMFTDKSIEKTVYIVDNGAYYADTYVLWDFKKFLNQYPDVIYLDAEQNLGFGKGQNIVINDLTSEYHAIVNPDVIFIEDALKHLIEYMDINRDVGMTIPLILDEDGNRQEAYRKELTMWDMFIRMFARKLFPKRIAKHTLSEMDYSKPFQVPFGQGSFLMVRTNLFKELNGFDEGFFMYLEDADLCKRVNAVSKLMYVPNAKVVHKWEQGSYKNKALFKIHLNSLKYYFKKWGWKLI